MIGPNALKDTYWLETFAAAIEVDNFSESGNVLDRCAAMLKFQSSTGKRSCLILCCFNAERLAKSSARDSCILAAILYEVLHKAHCRSRTDMSCSKQCL